MSEEDRKERRPTCRYHFTSLAAFDLHRVGAFDDGSRSCEYPEDRVSPKGKRLLSIQSHEAICRLGDSDVKDPVPVWEAA